NTCALQVSYALNFGGMPLHKNIKEKEYNAMYGRNRDSLYILGAYYMGKFLNTKWKEAEIKMKATDDGKNEVLQQLSNKKGIVVMQGNYSHTTLWSGKNFVDVENLGERYNFYFYMGTATLEFWELK
ncbi:type VI secretion system amidase effector protein Tae4, partial [Helicobacter sp. T3_23-1059]